MRVMRPTREEGEEAVRRASLSSNPPGFHRNIPFEAAIPLLHKKEDGGFYVQNGDNTGAH